MTNEVYIFVDNIKDSRKEIEYAKVYAEKFNLSKPSMLLKTHLGKPYFPDSNICISISHSNEYIVYAYSKYNVGIDIQLKRKANNEKISKRFFTKEENQFLMKNNYNDFCKIWCAKESYAKYTGQGIGSFSKFTVTDISEIKHNIMDAELKAINLLEQYEMFICSKYIDKIEIIKKT